MDLFSHYQTRIRIKFNEDLASENKYSGDKLHLEMQEDAISTIETQTKLFCNSLIPMTNSQIRHYSNPIEEIIPKDFEVDARYGLPPCS